MYKLIFHTFIKNRNTYRSIIHHLTTQKFLYSFYGLCMSLQTHIHIYIHNTCTMTVNIDILCKQTETCQCKNISGTFMNSHIKYL